ncbi:MAG: major capsid protein [Clostridia bacterium]|nr:major capsid protein [Clostridia bacterium]
MPELNFFDTYVLMAIAEEIVPQQTFFKDRYFPTEAGDIFAADKVLTEYRKGSRKMAAVVSPSVGDIPVERRGYSIHEYQPAFIAPSRVLTLDDLRKRGFGEALYPGMTPAARAAQLQLDDLTDMENLITRREEWMAVQTMINNACTMQEFIDAETVGDTIHVQFYDGASEHNYTVAEKWDTAGGDFFGDVKAMCRMLSRRGLRAADLVLGSDVADAILENEQVQRLLDKNSGIITGKIEQELSKYDGVVFMGTVNFGGFKLNLICVDETYVDDDDNEQKYFPATSAMVTAPACGHMMYGQITQIDFGSTAPVSHANSRVPKFILDQPKDIRKLRLASRPLAAPKNYCPYIYAADVVG